MRANPIKAIFFTHDSQQLVRASGLEDIVAKGLLVLDWHIRLSLAERIEERDTVGVAI